MKKIVLLLMMVVLLLLSSACLVSIQGLGEDLELNLTRGSGEMIEQDYEVSAVNAVEIDGFGVVHYVQGDEPSLTIEAEEGYLEDLEVVVSADRLLISPKNAWFAGFVPTETPHYYLTLPDTNEFTLSGAVKFEADEIIADEMVVLCNGGNDLNVGRIEANSLVLKAAGAANWSIEELMVTDVEIEISGLTNAALADVQSDSFTLVINGAASATVSGVVNTQTVEISGTGSYQAGDLRSSDATVRVSGASNLTVWATDDLYLNCDGAGSIEYWGSPRVTQNNSGLAVINSLGEKEE